MSSTSDDFKEYHFKAYCNLTKTLIILNSAGIASVISYIGITMTKIPIDKSSMQNLKIALTLFLFGVFISLVEAIIEYLSYFFYSQFEIEKLNGTKAAKTFFYGQLILISISVVALIAGGYIGFIRPFIIN